MGSDTYSREVIEWFLNAQATYYERGDRVADGPIRCEGFYVDPFCDPGCCRPCGPFPTKAAALEWSRRTGEAMRDGDDATDQALWDEQLRLSRMDMIAVIGASGRSGMALCRRLRQPFRAVVRNARKWSASGMETPLAVADLNDPVALKAALAGVAVVVSCVHARNIPAILAAAPPHARFVFMGSTRRYSRWPDAHGDGVRAGEAAFLASGRDGVMVHPTMIYGAQGEDNVQRLAALMRRLPLLPLPGGGANLVQPIHQDDVSDCLIAAANITAPGAQVITIAGPEPIPYRDFCAAIARAAGFAPRPVLPIPAWMLIAASPLTVLPGLPRIRAAEIRRLTEDKAFDIGPMRAILGVDPISLEAGLRATFSPTGD
ncbi:NAD(P)H-binding protein [Rhodovarius lipocyclicus]|uniref:NAD(P)H-binding protein n=1 Tax=Rhodovarius lipocyclicus TaxID=268410 RepID=UPI002E2978F6|nr:SDR family oxidoreductase [Rhodovarius lipocyclicus]